MNDAHATSKTSSAARNRPRVPSEKKTAIFSLIALLLVILAFFSTLAYGAYLQFGNWEQPEPKGRLASIGVIAANGTSLVDDIIIQNTPSLDLVPITSGQYAGWLLGIFRLNVPITPATGVNKFGLSLPDNAVVTPVGAGGETLTTQLGVAAYNGYGFSCASNGGPKELMNLKDPEVEFLINDTAGNAYDFQCLDTRMLAWMTLPAGRRGQGTTIDPATQSIRSTTAGHLTFRIPNYPGLIRHSYSSWTLNFVLETGLAVGGLTPIGTALAGNASKAVVTVGQSTQRFGFISPSGSSLEHRSYTMPDTAKTCDCLGPQLLDQGPAVSWSDLFDGSTHEMTVQLTDKDSDSRYSLVIGSVAFSSGLIIPAPWGLIPKIRGLKNPKAKAKAKGKAKGKAKASPRRSQGQHQGTETQTKRAAKAKKELG